MDNYTIYEDDEQKVEILGEAHRYFKEMIVKEVKASKETYNFLLSLILADIKEIVPISKITKKEVEITLCHQIPILQPHKGLCFKEPFNVFEEAFEFMSLVPDIHEAPNELMDDIENYYCTDSEFAEVGMMTGRIYAKPYKDIAGYLCFITKTEVRILFFGYEKNESEDDEFYF